MMGLFEAAWVIARRDFVASVFSKTFIMFLLAPMILFGFAFFFASMTDAQDQAAAQPAVAVVADSATADALGEARERLVTGTSEQSFPVLRNVAPAQHVAVQARALLADEHGGYSAVLSGTLDRPVLTGPLKADGYVAHRLQLLVDDARRAAALRGAGAVPPPAPLERVVTDQAAGNLQMIRRNIAKGGQTLIFTVTMLLATLLLSTLVEEKTNKIIEVLAAAVPLDAVFLGKLLAMLGISLVGLLLWAGMFALGYTTLHQMFEEWVTLPAGGAGDRLADLDRPPDPLFRHQFHDPRRFVPRHRRAGEQHPRDPDHFDAGDDAAAARLPARDQRRRPGPRPARADRLYRAVQLAAGDDRLRRPVRDFVAASARARLAGAVDRADHPRLLAPVQGDRPQIRLGRLLLLLPRAEGESRA